MQNPNSPELNEKQPELERHIANAEKVIKEVDYREANRRTEYAYVISNVGVLARMCIK